MADAGEKEQGSTRTPAEFLQAIKGKPVVVKLNSGVDYKGKSQTCHAAPQMDACAHRSSPDLFPGMLACLDGYMNIAMEQTEVRQRR